MYTVSIGASHDCPECFPLYTLLPGFDRRSPGRDEDAPQLGGGHRGVGACGDQNHVRKVHDGKKGFLAQTTREG